MEERDQFLKMNKFGF